MKTIKLSIKQIVVAAFLALLILAGNVSAKGTETGFASSLENSVESELTIEDWMVNDNHWNVVEQSVFYVESDKSLNIENWMTDASYWNHEVVTYTETDKEDEIKIENWMINEKFWNLQNSRITR